MTTPNRLPRQRPADIPPSAPAPDSPRGRAFGDVLGAALRLYDRFAAIAADPTWPAGVRNDAGRRAARLERDIERQTSEEYCAGLAAMPDQQFFDLMITTHDRLLAGLRLAHGSAAN